MYMMTTVRMSCASAKFTAWLCISRISGSGAPNIEPIETYISSAARQSAAIIPFRSRRKARASASASSSRVLSRFCAFICRAPKPAFSILPIICSGVTFASSYSISIRFIVRFTSLRWTPSSFRVTRSTAAEQAAQCIPSMR